MKIGNRAAGYVLFGLFFFLFWFLFKVGGMPDIPLAVLSTVIDVAVTMGGLIFTVEVLLPRLLYQRKARLFGTAFAGMVLLGGSLIIGSQLQLLGRSLSGYQKDLARYQEHYFYWFWADLIFGSYFMVFFMAAVGVAVRLSIDRVRSLNRLETLQKEKALSELELLKHQINPHFLFNALNTIYYKIDRANGQARDTLQQFSHMLRYQLYECNEPFIEVEKELAFIRSYIGLQQERLNDNYTVVAEGLEQVKGFMIAPFILMPLVENCFKHLSDHPDQENRVTIHCTAASKVFGLVTRNTVAVSGKRGEPGEPVVGSNGIGLENIRRRLDLLYPGRYKLVTENSPGWYEASLQLEWE